MVHDHIICAGLTNEQIYDLVVASHGNMHLLMHPDQYKYVKERLEREHPELVSGGENESGT
jgi:hypothetical protein